MKEKKCIYCGKGISEGVELSESDIIPWALTNRRIINQCVCKIEHNSKFSNDFESYVINNLAFFRNHLGIKGHNKNLPSYEAVYKIGDITIKNKKLKEKDEFFSGKPMTGERNGKEIKIASKDILEKFSNYDEKKFEEFDFGKKEIFQEIHISPALFSSKEMLRLAAKVGYEWYCLENRIYDRVSGYDEITDYIIKNTNSDSDVVTVVINNDLYNMINEQLGLGGHALGIVHAPDRHIYVIFSFFGLVIYKIKIRKVNIDFTDRKTVSFFGFHYDGMKSPLKINLSVNYVLNSVPSKVGIKTLETKLMENFEELLSYQIFTLRNFHSTIKDIKRFIEISDNNDKYNKLVGYKVTKRLFGLYVLWKIGKSKDRYNDNLTFNENLKLILNTDEKLVFKEGELFNIIDDIYETDNFFDLVKVGIEFFLIAYEKEV